MAIDSVFKAVATLAAAALLYQTVTSIISFTRNLRTAQKSGLPYIIRGVFEYNYFFLAVQPAITILLEKGPAFLNPGGRFDIYRHDWRSHVKYRLHSELGSVFWDVSPGYLMLEISDADVLCEVTTRRFEFVKPRWVFGSRPSWGKGGSLELMKTLENIRLFGENILEADEFNWKRHRRVLGPRYNDVLHSFVWEHASKLATEMLKGWQAPPKPYKKGDVARECHDFGALALRVIVGAAFGIFIPFHDPTAEDSGWDPATKKATEFADKLLVVLNNLVTCMIFPNWVIALFSQNIARSTSFVRKFLHDVLIAEKEKLDDAKASGLSAREIMKKDPKADGAMLRGIASATSMEGPPAESEITYDEAIGNIFLMALAGSATTGDTLHFSAVCLAANPDAQEWVLEQIDQVVKEEGDNWTYQNVFPKLTRIHHVMMETLRLYPVTPILPKWTENATQTLKVAEGHTIVLPPQTITLLNFPGVHHNPEYWGADVNEFKPQRWVDTKSLKEGAFAPFSRGARSCLGKRFSEAEFTSVLSTILRDYRVELDLQPGEKFEDVRQRTINALNASHTYLTLSVGDDVPLRWVKR